MTDFIELADDGESAVQRIAEALKDAREGVTFDAKIRSLTSAIHILLDPGRPNHLLDNFLDEMLEFATLGEHRLICLIIDFLQKACAKDQTLCFKTVERLSFYLTPNLSIQKYFKVIKRVIVACTNIYPTVLEYAITHGNESEPERCWEAFNVLKSRIIRLVDSDNDGIRTVTIKFLEALILCQSPKPKETVIEQKDQQKLEQAPIENEQNTRFTKISLNDITRSHRFLSYRKAQTEAEENFAALINQTLATAITAQNLMTVVDSLCLITRCRPQWENALPRVFEAMKDLHSNVPPMLSSGQVKALRKELKRNLLRFLKLPAAVPLQGKIRTQLTDYLGASSHEVKRAIPEYLIQKPPPRPQPSLPLPPTKRIKLEVMETNNIGLPDDDEDDEPSTSQAVSATATRKDAVSEAIEITTQYVYEHLNDNVVRNLVLISLLTLPSEMPPSFASSYTPIASAGTDEQKKEVSKMLATQFTHAEIGPGYEHIKANRLAEQRERENARSQGMAIATPIHNTVPSRAIPRVQVPVVDNVIAPVLKTKKTFNLIEETKELSVEDVEELFELAFVSVLRAERRVVQGGATEMYQQLVVRLVSRFKDDSSNLEDKLIDFIVADHKRRAELALLWICELYAQYQGFSYCSLWMKEQMSKQEGFTKEARFERYDKTVCKLLNALVEKQLQNAPLFYKLFTEAPLITTNAFEYLRIACLDTKDNAFGMLSLRELILTRNRQRPQLLQFFFSLCFLDRPQLRASCVETAKELCNLPHIRTSLSEHTIRQLQDCIVEPPPEYAQNPEARVDKWTDEMYRSALTIFTSIIPFDTSLLLPLGKVYADGPTSFKRVVLRTIESAINKLGMKDPQILALIEECPHGAETLVAKVVHILTEREPATPELVARAKKLHDERHMDIRALIPIIGGLSKDEVYRLIPQFTLRKEYQKSIHLVFQKIYNARDSHTGEPAFDIIELVTNYHLIEPKNEQEIEMHISTLTELFNNKMVKREKASQAIETVFNTEPLSYLFPYSLCILKENYPGLESFVSTLIQKVAQRNKWQTDEKTKKAFFECVRKLKVLSYTAVLTCFTLEEYAELKEYLGKEYIISELKEFFPTLSTSQQRSVDEKIKEEVYDKERESRDRRLRREEKREKERERDGRGKDSERSRSRR